MSIVYWVYGPTRSVPVNDPEIAEAFSRRGSRVTAEVS